MSKNIIIQEGGVGKQLTVDKLKTNLVGGGTCLWVPEDEHNLGTKYITENGTYNASDDGYYGYSQVSVSGIGTATGKDGDGDQAQTTVDPETGDLVTKKLIESIAVVTPPTVTTYQDGAIIDFSGISVHGYSTTGADLGEIPMNELVFPETIADYSKGSGEGEVIVDGLNSPVYLNSVGVGSYLEPDNPMTYMGVEINLARYISAMNGSAYIFIASAGNDSVASCFVSKEDFQFTAQRQCPPGWDPQIGTTRAHETTYSGYTGFTTTGILGPASSARYPISAQQGIGVEEAAILALFGGRPTGGVTQSIPVQYVNSEYATLTSGFNITVSEPT